MSQERFKVIPAVFLILKNDDSEVLLSQRLNTGFSDGNYGLVAGHVENGETATNALIREVKEEIGITVKEDDLCMSHVMYYGSRSAIYQAVFFFFTATQWQGEIANTEPEKCSDLRWFAIDNLPENIVSPAHHALECVQKGILYSEFDAD
jgi:mutator protein MutT